MSVNRELNTLRAALRTEQLHSAEVEARLVAVEARHRRAIGLLRDQHRSTSEIAKFLDEVPT